MRRIEFLSQGIAADLGQAAGWLLCFFVVEMESSAAKGQQLLQRFLLPHADQTGQVSEPPRPGLMGVGRRAIG